MPSETILLIQALGPYFIGLAGVTATAMTIRFVNRRQHQSEWEKRFLENYLAFWTDEKLVQVRYWITNDNGYGIIQPLLVRRCRGSKDISAEESDVLENIDRFCARLAAYDVVGASHKHDETHIPWVGRHREYWSGLIVDRPELRAYMKLCWPTLLGTWVRSEDGPSGNIRRPAPAEAELLSGRESGVADRKPDAASVLESDANHALDD